MAVFEGKKYEPSIGNMRLASSLEAETIQIILDLKTKVKLIQDEIAKRTKELPQNCALVTKASYNQENRYMTFLTGRPSWLHVPVPEIYLERHNTTIADKKSLNLNE